MSRTKITSTVEPGKGSHIGDRIRSVRIHLGMRQAEFCTHIKISTPSLSEIENHKYSPSLDTIQRIVNDFKVSLSYLVFGEGDMFGNEAHRVTIDTVSMNESEKEFLFLFLNSKVFRFHMLSQGNLFFLKDGNRESIKKEVDRVENPIMIN